MTINQNELLSAFVDGELQGDEFEQALQIVTTNEQARRQLQRYQLASDVLQGHTLGNQYVDLTSQISAALVDEPVFTQASTTNKKSQVIPFPKQFWKQATGLAVAASVGALAVMGVMTQPQNQLIPVTPVAAIDTPVVTVAQAGNRWTVGEPEVEHRLDTYLLDHNEYAGASGVFSYARVVSYDAGR
ncbi:MAG: anti-sigma factor [Gammaproteobacteria bacterium]|nr:MAG: anti-sigma factor [Gammaproteobacteria bacterium]